MITDFVEFISCFDVKTKRGDQYQCTCPAHDDKKASLSIMYDRKDNKALLYCHAGCNYEAVLSSIGMTKSDPFFDKTSWDIPEKEKWIQYIEKSTGHTVDQYYHHIDLSGKYVCTKIRLIPKDFRYGIVDDDNRIHLGLNGKHRKDLCAFYCKDYKRFKKSIQEGKPVFYVEGEKDVNTLYRYGMDAVTCGSATDWCADVAEVFAGASKVVIFADNDESGKKSAYKIMGDIKARLDISTEVIIPAPDVNKGDVSDLAEIHGKKGVMQLYNRSCEGMGYFHTINEKTGKCTGIYDYAIFQYLKSTRSIFILGKVPYIYDKGVYRQDITGARLKTMIRKLMLPVFIKSNTIKRVYDLFLSSIDLEIRHDQVNQYPDEWINFQNGFYDPVNKRMIKHHPKYMSVNQVPHVYDPSADFKNKDIIDTWLDAVVPDPDNREMLLQYSGYCLTKDIRQQVMLFIKGKAGSGKSTIKNVINAAVGNENIANVSIHKLSKDKFAAYGLINKLLNSCGDLSTADLQDPAEIKKLTGEFTIRVEAKGKDAIDIKTHAKMLFLCNQFPFINNEESEGFYRRLLILPVDLQPDAIDIDIFNKLLKGINYFIHLSILALERMYEKGRITISDISKQEVKRVWIESDSVKEFIEKLCILDPDEKWERVSMYEYYDTFCTYRHMQSKGKKAFYKSVRAKGIFDFKTSGLWYFRGITANPDLGKNLPEYKRTFDYMWD